MSDDPNQKLPKTPKITRKCQYLVKSAKSSHAVPTEHTITELSAISEVLNSKQSTKQYERIIRDILRRSGCFNIRLFLKKWISTISFWYKCYQILTWNCFFLFHNSTNSTKSTKRIWPHLAVEEVQIFVFVWLPLF